MHGPGHVTRKQRIPLQALRGRERKRSRFETREERTLEDVDARRRLEDRKMPVIGTCTSRGVSKFSRSETPTF